MIHLGAEAAAFVDTFIEQERLPRSYVGTVERFYGPLARNIRALIRRAERVPVVGINGAQGTGKSTCAACVAGLLAQQGVRALVLSIDDLYYPKAERKRLAAEVHPLLITRGVPGTHDMALFGRLVAAVRGEMSATDLEVPRFDKSVDDRSPQGSPLPEEGVDVILFEGWCVGAVPENAEALTEPMNELERQEDVDGHWRAYVNEQLAGIYTEAFALIDYLVMLKAPDFEMIYAWRGEQEQKLRERLRRQGLPEAESMNEQELAVFIAHYERLTRWMLQEMPERADELVLIGEDHEVYSRSRRTETPLRYLISTDLDATLLDETYSWEAARPALLRLAELNACVVLNSSKTVSEMKALAAELVAEVGLAPAPLVAENGGVLALPEADGGYRIEHLGLSRTAILSVAHRLRAEHDYCFFGFADMEPDKVMELTGLSRAAAVLAMERQATEPLCWNDTEERRFAFASALKQEGIRMVRGGRFFHLMGAADKAAGLEAALAYSQKHDPAALWCSVALGDSPNDQAMLNAADVAVAIENSVHGRVLKPAAMFCIEPPQLGPTAWNEAVLTFLNEQE